MSKAPTPFDRIRPQIMGNPYHGLVKDGQLTLPNGQVMSLGGGQYLGQVWATPSSWGSVPDRSETADPAAYQLDQQNGWQWQPYALVHDFKRVYGRTFVAGGRGWLFKSSDGKVWAITIQGATLAGVDEYAFSKPGAAGNPIDGDIVIKARRFGVLDLAAASAVEYEVSIPTPAGTVPSPEDEPQYYDWYRQLLDVRPDAGQAVLRYEKDAGVGVPREAYGYVVIDVADVTAGGVSASASLVKSRSDIAPPAEHEVLVDTSDQKWWGVSAACGGLNDGYKIKVDTYESGSVCFGSNGKVGAYLTLPNDASSGVSRDYWGCDLTQFQGQLYSASSFSEHPDAPSEVVYQDLSGVGSYGDWVRPCELPPSTLPPGIDPDSCELTWVWFGAGTDPDRGWHLPDPVIAAPHLGVDSVDNNKSEVWRRERIVSAYYDSSGVLRFVTEKEEETHVRNSGITAPASVSGVLDVSVTQGDSGGYSVSFNQHLSWSQDIYDYLTRTVVKTWEVAGSTLLTKTTVNDYAYRERGAYNTGSYEGRVICIQRPDPLSILEDTHDVTKYVDGVEVEATFTHVRRGGWVQIVARDTGGGYETKVVRGDVSGQKTWIGGGNEAAFAYHPVTGELAIDETVDELYFI